VIFSYLILQRITKPARSVGNVLWNWRMLQLTGDAKYADIMGVDLVQRMLSGISLSGTKFLYTNPLSVSDDMPFQQRCRRTG